MNIRLNKDKSIGKVLFIVEGSKTEPYLLHRIFCDILNYRMETLLRNQKYRVYNSDANPTSKVFVINAEESNIKHIKRDNQFLDNLFRILVEDYDFDVNKAAVYYLFDRDNKSNTDEGFIREMLSVLTNARDNEWDRQGILLLSYPSVEAFTLSNFVSESFEQRFDTGNQLKQRLHELKINQSHITEESLEKATQALFDSFDKMNLEQWNLDEFGETNRQIFEYEEGEYDLDNTYRALSLLCIALLDLGILETDDEPTILPKAPTSVNMDMMSSDEIHKKLQEGYEDVVQGNV